MGNEFEINKITDQTLRALANAADTLSNGNSNGKLDSGAEISVFEDLFNKLEEGDQRDKEGDFKEIMGYFPSNSQSTPNTGNNGVQPQGVNSPQQSQGHNVGNNVSQSEQSQDTPSETVYVSQDKIYPSQYRFNKAVENGNVQKGEEGLYVVDQRKDGKKYTVSWNNGEAVFTETNDNIVLQNSEESQTTKGSMKQSAREMAVESEKGFVATTDELKAWIQNFAKNKPEEYQAFATKLNEYVENASTQPHETRSDLKKLKQNLEKQIRQDNIKVPVEARKTAVDVIVGAFEADVIKKAYDEINDMAKESSGDSEFVNYGTLANNVKKQLKSEGKWENEHYYKVAYNEFVNNGLEGDMSAEMRGDAREIFAEDIEGLPQTKGKVKKSLKDSHNGKAGSKDNMYNGAVNDNKTLTEISKRRNKVLNRRKELESVSESEIKNHLGNKILLMLNEYKNEDGTYDLRSLSEAIEKRAGKDWLVNSSSNTLISEMEGIREELIADGVAENLTNENDVKKLIKFCKFKIEGKDHTLGLGTLGSTAEGAVAGAGGVLVSNATKQAIKIVINHDPVDVNIAINVANQLSEMANQGLINIDQELLNQVTDSHILIQILRDPTSIEIIPKLLDGVATGGITGAAVGLVLGLISDLIFGKDKEEIACLNPSDYDINNTRYTNKHEYEEYIQKSLTKDQYNRLKVLLDRFPAEENGDWDHAGFFNLIRQMGGFGITNCQEIQGNEVYGDIDTHPYQSPCPEQEKPAPQEELIKFKVTTTETKTETKTYTIDTFKNANRYGWADVSKMYDCFDGMNINRAKRMMEVIQAIDPAKLNVPGHYDIDLISDVVAKAFTSSFAPNWNYINNQLENDFPQVKKDVLKAVLTATYLGDSRTHEIIAPNVLYNPDDTEACHRDDTRVKRPQKSSSGSGSSTGAKPKPHNTFSTTHKEGSYQTTTSSSSSKYYVQEENKQIRQKTEDEYNKSRNKDVTKY